MGRMSYLEPLVSIREQYCTHLKLGNLLVELVVI